MEIEDYKKQVGLVGKRTLCFLFDGDNILLWLKKSWFWKGNFLWIWWKVEKFETVEQATVREFIEETAAKPINLKKVWVLNFYFPYVDTPDKWNQQVHVYTTMEWENGISESEEIRPQWFRKNEIPFDLMWDDNKYWFPFLLNGEKFSGDFIFNKDLKVEKYNIKVETHI